MTQRFFEVQGQLVDRAGEPVKGVWLSVLDADGVSDDLIGVGMPRDDGSFCVSFTREAFNQDWFENEALPDLYVVVSRLSDQGDASAFFQKEFPGLAFEGGKEDLGKIVVTDTSPPTRIKGAVIYDFSKVRRVDVDDEVIAHVFAAVSERVKEATGWEGVGAGVAVRQTVEMLSVLQQISKDAIGSGDEELPWWSELQQRVQQTVLGGLAALYDPFKQEIWLDRNVLGQAGLDLMKASMAHELVHAGQFRHHPELVEAYRSSLRSFHDRMAYCTRKDPTEPMSDRLVQDLLSGFVFMCNLEGYARFVEKRFFAQAHTCQHYVPQFQLALLLGAAPVVSIASRVGSTLHEAVTVSDPSPEHKAAAWLASLDPVAYKMEQYGCDRWYETKQKGDEPVAFLPTLGQELLPQVVKVGAEIWDKHRSDAS
jgi:hypothetical protein